MVEEGLGAVEGEAVRQELLVLRDGGPRLLGRRAQNFEDEVQLVLHGGARKQRPSARHLVKYTAHAPEVMGRKMEGLVGGWVDTCRM